MNKDVEKKVLYIFGIVCMIISLFLPFYKLNATTYALHFSEFLLMSIIINLVGLFQKKYYYKSALSLIATDIVTIFIEYLMRKTVFGTCSFGVGLIVYIVGAICLIITNLMDREKVMQLGNQLLVPTSEDDLDSFVLGKYILGLDGGDPLSDAVIVDESEKKELVITIVEKKNIDKIKNEYDLVPETHIIKYDNILEIKTNTTIRMTTATDSMDIQARNVMVHALTRFGLGRMSYALPEAYEMEVQKMTPVNRIYIKFYDDVEKDEDEFVFETFNKYDQVLVNLQDKIKK